MILPESFKRNALSLRISDLGISTPPILPRGCTGMYRLRVGSIPIS